jgi:sulfite reductase alpha subunit
MINTPRYNPYIFYDREDVPGGWEIDAEAFRKKHHA